MRLAAILGAATLLATTAAAAPPIEAYGELPDIWGLNMSPSGKRFAYLSHGDAGDFFVIAEPGRGMIGGARTGEVKARFVLFPSEDYAVVVASQTEESRWFIGKLENSQAFSYDIKEKRLTQLLRNYEDLYPYQSGLGDIIGRLEGTNRVFMPAFVGRSTPEYGVLEVDLRSSNAGLVTRGNADTNDYVVDRRGVVLAREDYDAKTKTHRIFTKRSGAWEKIHETVGTEPKIALAGSMPSGKGLVVLRDTAFSDYTSLATLGFDGSLSLPIFKRNDAAIERILTDANREVIGVEFTGLYPSYQFFDAGLGKDMTDLAAAYPNDAVRLQGWTADFGILLLSIEGGGTAPGYFTFDRKARTIARLAKRYAEIESGDVAQVITIEYKARDGRKIPSILTLPNTAKLGDTLPLIVLPHGGPQSYDAVGFDYMAQYFASRGYMVFQPNFRGSDGFGEDHIAAGYGEWGGKMQDDITDGVRLLVQKRWADGNRVCIAGGSYGGYAALAGGAFTPDLYKCVIAIAPVSDLTLMLRTERREDEDGVYEYWKKLIGDLKSDATKIAAISPVNSASSFKAPVLLIHGNDDIVVPFEHSARMKSALERAGKPVTLVKLKNEDHWLSKSDTRLQTLREMDRFIAETLGAN